MAYKWMGAALVVLSCGSFGMAAARVHRREEDTLRQLIGVLDYMECELQYRLTPLPDLCIQAAGQCTLPLSRVFALLGRELEQQLEPDVSGCMATALGAAGMIPERTRKCLLQLGRNLGRFDLDGQIRGLDGVRVESRRILAALTENREVRLRSYQTLGLCGGAALAILLI